MAFVFLCFPGSMVQNDDYFRSNKPLFKTTIACLCLLAIITIFHLREVRCVFFPWNWRQQRKFLWSNKIMATLLESIQTKYGADDDNDQEDYGWIVFVSNSPECKKGMFPPIMTLSDYDISNIGKLISVRKAFYPIIRLTTSTPFLQGTMASSAVTSLATSQSWISLTISWVTGLKFTFFWTCFLV